MPLWGFLASLLVAFMWAVSPILQKEGLKYGTPNEIPAVRSISFFLTMAALMLATQPGKMPFMTPKLFAGLLVSVALSSMMGDLFFAVSINKIGASLAVSISSSYPLIAALVSVFALHERVKPLVWCGTVFIVLGIVIIQMDASRRKKIKTGFVVEDFGEMLKRRADTRKGILFASVSALCSGINIPILKLLMDKGGWNPTESYFMRAAVFFFMAWGMRAIQRRWFPSSIKNLAKLPVSAWIYFLASGVVGIALSGVLFGVCIVRFPVSVVTPITASSPFMTVMLSRIFLKEHLTRVQSAGIALVIAGSVSVSL
ncbi:MAG: DMT family transporter [Synergistaceae bacterium]|jgi:DME family drug/metabolite transporter|nr:DMT family transporter [Synergistaceae bacterium]